MSKALDDSDMRILARLGAGLLMEWNSLSQVARKAIFATASTLHAERDAARIKREIERFASTMAGHRPTFGR